MAEDKPQVGLDRAVRILVVDDEEVVRAVIRDGLDRPGLYLVEAVDGEAAIGLLLREPFDLIICDKNLPGITGLDVIRRARAVDPRMAVLLVTAYASRESAEEALALGIDEYITKPFELSDLESKVDEALERRGRRVARLQQAEPRPARPRQRIVICDPQPGSRALLEAGLQRLGHRVRTAAGLSQVLEALRRKDLDALVCDLEILNRDDASACFLRSTLILSPDVRFVALAGERGLEAAIQAVHRGAGKVLYRPLVSADEVVEVLGAFLADEDG